MVHTTGAEGILTSNTSKSNAELDEMGFEYELKLRDYQKQPFYL